jgi:hypothetical protein
MRKEGHSEQEAYDNMLQEKKSVKDYVRLGKGYMKADKKANDASICSKLHRKRPNSGHIGG